MDYLLMFVFIFKTWIVIGIAFLVFELFDGSTIFFLPLSLSSFVTSAYVFALENVFLPSILFFDQWYELLLFWALLGLIISLALVKFWKRSTFDDSDVNNY
jgi:membrane protein implicated in regulation of membrane protease activity